MMNRRAFLSTGGVWLSSFGVKPAPGDSGENDWRDKACCQTERYSDSARRV
jgi:hypothetical protein